MEKPLEVLLNYKVPIGIIDEGVTVISTGDSKLDAIQFLKKIHQISGLTPEEFDGLMQFYRNNYLQIK